MAEMEHKQLSEWIRILPANALERTNDCPDDHDLAAFVDGFMHPETTELLRLHLADCDFCMTQVGLLKRLYASNPDHQFSEFVLARARHMGKANKRPAIRHVTRWATAAVLVLAVLVVFKLGTPNPVETQATGTTTYGQTSQAPDQSQIRSQNLNISKLRVLAPAKGALIDPGKLVFQWTDVPDCLYYDVRIVTDGGDLIWKARIEDTKLELPDKLQLDPDVEYYFRVDAYLASAKSIHSQHVLFSVMEQR